MGPSTKCQQCLCGPAPGSCGKDRQYEEQCVVKGRCHAVMSEQGHTLEEHPHYRALCMLSNWREGSHILKLSSHQCGLLSARLADSSQRKLCLKGPPRGREGLLEVGTGFCSPHAWLCISHAAHADTHLYCDWSLPPTSGEVSF